MFKPFFKKKKKDINLIDFSIQEVSTGQVEALLNYLAEHKDFKNINVDYRKNHNADVRCYLTINNYDRRIVQWFSDRNSSQIENFAKEFYFKNGKYVLDKE